MAGIIQGLDLNFNLYLLIHFIAAYLFNIEFMLSEKDSTKRSTSCWSTWRISDQLLPK